MYRVCVTAPATAANLGPGFDALGMALGIYNEVEIGLSDRPEVAVCGEGEGILPEDEENLVYRAAQTLARAAGHKQLSFAITCRNRIPIGRGLGSSAAAIAAGLVGANALLGEPLDLDRILSLAVQLEGHPDNVVAALVGGVTVAVRDGEGVRWARIPVGEFPRVVLAIPDFPLPTHLSRARLPLQVPFEDAAFNTGRTALLVAALAGARWDLVGTAMEDRLHQPYRKDLVPGFEEVCAAARAAGAVGAALSGAGPSVLAIAEAEIAEQVAAAMEKAFAAHGVRAQVVVTELDVHGVRIGAIPLRR